MPTKNSSPIEPSTSMSRTIMIACVTVEVAMVVSPALYYKPDEIRLFRYIRDPGTPKAKIYGDHYREVCRQIHEKLPGCEIHEEDSVPVYDFVSITSALGALRTRLSEEYPGARFLANISSGPAEFVAALGVFCFLNPDARMFRVSTRKFSVTEEEFAEMHYSGGKAVGMSLEVSDPREIECVRLEKPEENIVRALRLYAGFLDEGIEPTYHVMIPALKEKGLWGYGERLHRGGKQVDRERQHFQREYNRTWEENGWVDVRDGRKRHRLTPLGRTVLQMFYTDE